jgi:hypothetical protein
MNPDEYDRYNYDDGGPGVPGDGDGDDQGEHPRVRAARRKVNLIGKLLAIFGAFSLVLALAQVAILALNPGLLLKPYYNTIADMMANQPQQNQQQALPPYEEFEKDSVVQGLIGGILQVICSIPILMGGMAMRQLKGYVLSIVGAVLALIPCTNTCCCAGFPLGIWAIIVLANSDVKTAFRCVAQ